jgi:hypothetical protein
MPKEIILDVTTAIIVLGSVFGASHWRKITARLRKILRDKRLPRKPPQRAAPASSAMPDSPIFYPPIIEDEGTDRRRVS